MARKAPRPYTLGFRASVDSATRAEWARRLREAREERGITQRAIADQLGCTRATISAYERGVNTPSPEVRRALARALKRPASRLFPEPVAA
ncbi:MAG: helix-turn-helix transcriptional regulator [Mycobacterium sp.]